MAIKAHPDFDEIKQTIQKLSKTTQLKRSLEKEREQLFAKLQEINRAIQKAEVDTEASEKLTLAKLRSALGWSRNQLACVMARFDRAAVRR